MNKLIDEDILEFMKSALYKYCIINKYNIHVSERLVLRVCYIFQPHGSCQAKRIIIPDMNSNTY